MLAPVETDEPVAPESLLKLVSYGCKGPGGKACGCRNLHYTAPLCAATVRVELVQTLQLSQMKTLDLIPKRPKNIHKS